MDRSFCRFVATAKPCSSREEEMYSCDLNLRSLCGTDLLRFCMHSSFVTYREPNDNCDDVQKRVSTCYLVPEPTGSFFSILA